MKSPMKWNRASGSTKRRIERVMRLGERGARRALPSEKRREFLTRVGYAA